MADNLTGTAGQSQSSENGDGRWLRTDSNPSISHNGRTISSFTPGRLPTWPENMRFNDKSKKRTGSLRVPHQSNPVQSVIDPVMEEKARIGLGTRHYNIRTIPPWIRDADADDVEYAESRDCLGDPDAAFIARHNSTPSESIRAYASARYGFLISSGSLRQEPTSRWISFARPSAYPRERFDGEKVDADWLNENFTDYSKPWLAGHDEKPEDGSSIYYRKFRRKRRAWYERAQFTVLRNPFIPLALRGIVLMFAAIAIGLGGSIFYEANGIIHCNDETPGRRSTNCVKLIGQDRIDYYRDPSAEMAIIVDSIALAYTLYITYDEYFSKPLGLRKARAKVRLVLLDLFFIVFQASNLTLAFESLTVSDGSCTVGKRPDNHFTFHNLCGRAEALSAVLLVSLVAWLLTFSVSILRLVERINTR